MGLFDKKTKEVVELRQQLEIKNEQIEKQEKEIRELSIGGVSIEGTIALPTSGVIEEEVMRIPTAKACVDLITGSIAQMPIYLYKENEDGSVEKLKEDKRVRLLNHENEADMSAIDFKKLMVKDYVLRGQSFAFIEKTAETVKIGGMVEQFEELAELNHLAAKNIQTEVFHNGFKYTGAEYTLTTITGTSLNRKTNQTKFKQEQLLRVLNSPVNAYEGIGVLNRGEKIFKQAKDELEYTSNIFGRGALPLGILKMAGRLSQNAVDRLRASWHELYSGAKNSAKTVILEEGMEYQPISMKPNDLQLNESKTNTDSQICKLFGVPESMITTAANKYGSIAQNQLHFLKHTLAPIIGSFESAFDRQLLTEQEKAEGYYFRFDTSELLRATDKERVEAVSEGLSKGLYTINEARQKLDLPDIDEDVFLWGLQSVLFNPKTGEMKVPNMGLTGKDDLKNEN